MRGAVWSVRSNGRQPSDEVVQSGAHWSGIDNYYCILSVASPALTRGQHMR